MGSFAILLHLTHQCRYGNWDRVRSSIRRCERFRFDYYLLSSTAEALGKRYQMRPMEMIRFRCESLMRLAEREIIEIDRKQQAADSANTSSDTAPADENLSSNERLTELVKQIAEEARRLANTRAELQKAKKQHADLVETEKLSKSTSGKKTKAQPSAPAEAPTETHTAEPGHKGIPKMPVPEHLVPELCRFRYPPLFILFP